MCQSAQNFKFGLVLMQEIVLNLMQEIVLNFQRIENKCIIKQTQEENQPQKQNAPPKKVNNKTQIKIILDQTSLVI